MSNDNIVFRYFAYRFAEIRGLPASFGHSASGAPGGAVPSWGSRRGAEKKEEARRRWCWPRRRLKNLCPGFAAAFHISNGFAAQTTHSAPLLSSLRLCVNPSPTTAPPRAPSGTSIPDPGRAPPFDNPTAETYMPPSLIASSKRGPCAGAKHGRRRRVFHLTRQAAGRSRIGGVCHAAFLSSGGAPHLPRVAQFIAGIPAL